MKITKFTKILPIALALSLSIGSVYAEDSVDMDQGEQNTQTVNYTLTLSDYIRITTESSTTSSPGSYLDKYANLTLTKSMGALFRVYSNKPSRILTLSSITSGISTMYGFANGGDFKIVFVNTANGGDSASIEGITEAGNAPDLASSPNAFALAVTSTLTHGYSVADNVGGEGDSVVTGGNGITAEFDANTKSIKYTMANGIADINLVFGTTALDNTFDTRDTSGIYTANLTLTDSSGS